MANSGSNGDEASAPRWVKVSGIVAIVLALLLVAMHLAGGGFRHRMPEGDAPVGHTPPSKVTDHGEQRP